MPRILAGIYDWILRAGWLCLWLVARHATRGWITSKYLEITKMAHSQRRQPTALVTAPAAEQSLDVTNLEIARRVFILSRQFAQSAVAELKRLFELHMDHRHVAFDLKTFAWSIVRQYAL
jgi:hypothetical protein